VVEGSVRREGENLRVTAQLISVKDGFHLWSKTYDRKMVDALAIQTEIANAVADALKTRLDTSVRPVGMPRDPQAYQLQLTSRAHLRRWGLEDLQAAREGFQRLATLEPDNASAYAGLAQATMLLAQNHLALDFEEARRLSEAAVDRALKIDPRSVDAWLARAYVERVLTVRTGDERHQERMGEAGRQALKLDPRNAEALAVYAVYLGDAGDPGQAVAYARRALAVDPLNRLSQMLLARQLVRLDRLEDAARQYRAAIDLYPDFDDAKLAADGDYKEALAFSEAQHATDADPFWTSAILITGTSVGETGRVVKLLKTEAPHMFLPEPKVGLTDLDEPIYAAHAIAAEGDKAQARRILERVLAITAPKPGRRQPPERRVARARAYVALGQLDAAMAELTQAQADGWRSLFTLSDYIWLDRHPTLSALQADPRFQAMVGRIRADMARQRAEILAQRK
jgi:tetratricopeptide (TPR) repeat protein